MRQDGGDMSEATHVIHKELGLRHKPAFVLGDGFAPLAAALDALLILALSVAAGVLYHSAVYDSFGVLQNSVRIGLLAAFFYVAPRILLKQYDVAEMCTDPSAIKRVFYLWNFAFFCVLAIGFVSKLTDVYSRGSILLFYACGMVGLMLLRAAMVSFVLGGFRNGWLVSKRLMVLGTESKVRAFHDRISPQEFGLQIADAELLPEKIKGEGGARFADRLSVTLQRAVEKARSLKVDNIVLLVPWSDTTTIGACRDAFLEVPAATLLGPEHVLDRALDSGLCRIGPTAGVNLVRAPLSNLDTFAKRTMDILVASAALVLLLPVLAIVALLIKLDSRGPVFFFQLRHGFNQKPFRIIKFRTMTVTEDCASFRQATRDDPRITRIGRFLRRWNLDELPQVLNVLKGEMSIVGPRPHALIHNHEFRNRIALYARRHNVKPGITGWAQVNGYRGQTDTDDKMRGRVEHDLYYIDHWSIWFDIQIILMTAFTRRAFSNAF